MKRLLLFGFAIVAIWGNASAYDFKVGNLYYNVISSADLTVEVTSQYGIWHIGTQYYYSIDGGTPGRSDYFRSGFYDYYDDKGRLYSSSMVGCDYNDSRTNRYSDNSLHTHIPCTDPYGTVNIPQTVTYQNITFTVTRIGNHAFYGCRGLLRVTIPSSVVSICDSAFWGCSRLYSVLIDGDMTNIGNSAFKQCVELNSFTTNGRLISIGDNAFQGCHDLTVIDIPTGLETIGDSSFHECTQLTTIHFDNIRTPPLIGTGALVGVPSFAFLYVPCNFTSFYQQDPSWGIFSHFIGVGAAGYLSVGSQNNTQGTAQITDSADCNTPATIQARANYGYHFISWNDGNTDNPRIVTVISDTSFTAHFGRNRYYIQGITNNRGMGTVTGSDSAYYLDSVTLTSIANYGYVFSHWDDNVTDNPRRVAASGSVIRTAYFDSAFFSLSALTNNEQMGYARIGRNAYMANAVGNYKYLSSQILYATANSGYQFMRWSDGVTSNPRTVTILSDTSFRAQFARQYTLTVLSNNGAMGNVSGNGLFNNNSTAVISAQANQGYHFSNWNDGVTTASRTIRITSDTSFTAYFAPNQYSITATSANQSLGMATGSRSALYGDTITLTATPIGQHHFTYWTDGDSTYYNNPLHVRVTRNKTYTAYFTINQYSITILTNGGGNGFIGTTGTTNHGNYDYLTQLTIRAVPNAGMRFVQWTDGNTYNPRTITLIEDTVYTATFAADLYTVTATTANPTMGSVTGGGTYLANDIATIAAIPNYGYKFHHWQDNDTTNPRSLTINTNSSFTAYFTTYDSVHIHDTTYIDIHDTTYINIHDTTYVTRTDTLTVIDTLWLTQYDTIWIHDTITLYDTIYVPQDGIGNVGALNAKVYSCRGQIVIEGADGNTVTLYDINGRILAIKRDDHTSIRFDAPASGTYIIKIGNHASRKVVVMR